MNYQKKIGIGRTAETFMTAQGTALKLFYEFMPGEAVGYEYAVSKKVSAACAFVPEVYTVRQNNGRGGIEFELISGQCLVDLFARYPLRIKVLSRRMGKLHREIHRNALPGLRTSVSVYSEALEKYPFLHHAERSRLLRFLEDSAGKALCHGDFHPENILVNRAGDYKVIDWINATSGNPLADVARTCYLMQSAQSPRKRPFLVKLFESQLRLIINKHYLKGYFQNRTVPKEDFSLWDLIIRIHRYYESMAEEKAFLEKTIKKAVKRLM